MMTDALAACFLAEWEARRRPWNSLPTTQLEFTKYIKARRDDGKLKNDDVTLIDVTL